MNLDTEKLFNDAQVFLPKISGVLRGQPVIGETRDVIHDLLRYLADPTTCPKCHGTGAVHCTLEYHGNSDYDYTECSDNPHTCPKCNGEGWITRIFLYIKENTSLPLPLSPSISEET